MTEFQEPLAIGGCAARRGSLRAALLIAAAAGTAFHADLAAPATIREERPARAPGLFKAAPDVTLEAGFVNPPAIARVQCWWQLPGSAITRKEATRELEEFKARGMGGVTLKDTLEMPRDEHTAQVKDVPFMSDDWLDLFAHIVAECGRLGLICRSRSSSGWNEGGPWIPLSQSSKALAFARSAPVRGPSQFAGPIPRDAKGQPEAALIKSGDLAVLAVEATGKEVADLTDTVNADGTLFWKVPEGTWTILSCFGKPTGTRLMSTSKGGAGLHHDHLSREAADLHLRLFGGRMSARLGKFKETAFDGFNSDGFEFGNPTWTPGLREIFRQRCRYDLAPWLPVLAGFDLGDRGRRFRYDFQRTISDLVVTNFYQHSSAWCRERGVAFEAQGVGGPGHALPMDFISACGEVDIPMGEAWIHGRTYARIASSAAHAHGKRLVGLEFTTQKDWFFAPTPALFKLRADEVFLLGANYLCLPCVDYSPPEAGSPGWLHSQPCRLGLEQTWWPLSRPLFDYLARCCFLLQAGTNVADVAIYNSFLSRDRMLWLAPDDDRLSSQSRHFSFDYVNDGLVGRMRVQGGQLTLDSGAAYKALYVSPPVLTSAGMERITKPFTEARAAMPLETLVQIRDLLNAGATVLWAGGPPEHCPSLKDYPASETGYAAVAAELWQHPRLIKIQGDGDTRVAAVLDRSPVPPAWRLPGDAPLRVAHRRTAEADFFFIVNRGVLDQHPTFTDLLAARHKNTGDVDELFEEGTTSVAPVLFRVKGRTPELWIPETGEIRPARVESTPEGALVSLDLPPQRSVFVVFRNRPGTAGPTAASTRETRPPKPAVSTVEGPWEVSFPPGWGAPPELTLAALESWTASTNSGIRHFNGIATYKKTLSLASAPKGGLVMLDLGRVASICEASLNGKPLGIAWKPPYQFDITSRMHAGANELEVRVANTWHNRLVADAPLPRNERVTRIYPEARYNRYRGRPLMTSGLLGPVRILKQNEGNRSDAAAGQ